MNHLQNASSKYLLQHAHNPVDWYSWGDEPFEKAQKENKPVLVSIGYAACHWCHVMEQESFEDPGVAAIMNENFVCIKVDREEHPDVDHFYMDALQSLSGNGGWPLNMFVTPQKQPFYGGTYFPPKPMHGRNSWPELLKAIAKAWKENPEEIFRQSEQMMQHLKQVSVATTNAAFSAKMDMELTEGICRNLLANADTEWGGFGAAPKFPTSFAIQFLLDFFQLQKNREAVDELGERALKQAMLTLDKMLSGGIYDQVGGGFFRYATDAHWQIPHYEKMLYDNALMISTLSVAYRVTKKNAYKRALKETVAFCNRELRHPDNLGFYCSLDADTDGIEGGYYLWTTKDWNEALPSVHPAIEACFGMEGEDDLSVEHPLMCALTDAEICHQFQLSENDWALILKEAKEKLLQQRSIRKRPETDDKMLLSWNALMNTALQDAALALNAPVYLQQAEQHLKWMQQTFGKNKADWKHVFKEGQAYIDAKLDDFAFFIRAQIGFAGKTGKNEFLKTAADNLESTIRFFLSEGKPYFYYSSCKQKDVPLRKIEIYDGAQPSANAVMAEVLYLSGVVFGRNDWLEQYDQMLGSMATTVHRYARSFSYWAILIQRMSATPKQVVLSGFEKNKLLQQGSAEYFPEAFVCGCDREENEIPLFRNKFEAGSPKCYLCYQSQCLKPVDSMEMLSLEIKKIK